MKYLIKESSGYKEPLGIFEEIKENSTKKLKKNLGKIVGRKS